MVLFIFVIILDNLIGNLKKCKGKI